MNIHKLVMRQAGFVLLALLSAGALAAGAGTVTHLSGTLSVQRADGSVRILSQKSEVNPGDVLTTQRDSYAQINFTDGSSLTMRPNTQIKVEQYNFVQDRPQDDRYPRFFGRYDRQFRWWLPGCDAGLRKVARRGLSHDLQRQLHHAERGWHADHR